MNPKKLIQVVVALVFLLSACAPNLPTVSPKTQKEPVILHIGWSGMPDTLNPASANLTESYTIFDLIYSTLTVESPAGGYVGGLASQWTYSDDGLTWLFTLKPGIKWQNGEPLKASDVVWSIQTVLQNPDAWATEANYLEGFRDVAALDDRTIQITLDHPISNMEYRLSCIYAVYPKDFEQFTTSDDLQKFQNLSPVGTGPFKISTYDNYRGRIILDANRAYFDGAPKIDGIIFQTYPHTDSMVRALSVGDIDMMTDVPQEFFGKVKALDTVEVVASPGRYFNELIINSVPANHDPAPSRNPALEDPQVRLALAMAIDKKSLLNQVLWGLGELGDTIVPPTLGGGFWHNPNIPDIVFDIQGANTILDQDGYILGPDGVRTNGSLRLEFRLQYPADKPLYPEMATRIAAWFNQIGVKADPQAVDPDVLTANQTPKGDFDLILWGWGPDPDPDFILSVMTTSQFVEGGWNDSGYSNSVYDQLYKDQQVALDRYERQQIIWKMQSIVYNDRPYIVLWYQQLLQAYRYDRFKGFIPSPLGIDAAASLVQVEPVR